MRELMIMAWLEASQRSVRSCATSPSHR